MPRGNVQQTKVVYQGKEEDFIVFVDSTHDLEAWKKDRSIPLVRAPRMSGQRIHRAETIVCRLRS